MKYVNSENFEEEVIKNNKVVLVDFFATWCGPCKTIAPILENIAQERENFEIVKVDIDENKELAYKYEILVVPTLVVFKDGRVVNEVEGIVRKRRDFRIDRKIYLGVIKMKGYILNPDKEYVNKIIEGIHRKNGHCPCKVKDDDTTLCPCDEFIKIGVCKCRLYLNKED